MNRPDNPDFAEGVAALVEQARPDTSLPCRPTSSCRQLPPFVAQ